MKRIFLGMVTTLVALGLVGSAFAAPSVSGSRGLFQIIDANNHGPMSFSIGSYVEYATKSKTYGTGATAFTYKQDHIVAYPALSFTPIKFIELSAGVPYAVSMKQTRRDTVRYNPTGLGDAEVGLKFSYVFSPMFTAGLRGVAMVPTLADTFKGVKSAAGNYPIQNNVDVGGLALLSFNFMDKAKLHINGGALYTMDKRDSANTYVKINSPITVNFGGGLEVNAIPFVTPMVEVTSSYPMLGDSAKDFRWGYIQKSGSTAWAKPGPMDYLWVTGGLRFGYTFGGVHNLNLTAGAELPMGSDIVGVSGVSLGDTLKSRSFFDWVGIGGLTYAYVPPVGPKVPPTGSIAGSVTDVDGNPIGGADVAFTGTSVAPVTSGADGKFAATGLPVGMITVSVSKEGFISKDETPTIAKKKVVELAVKLEKKPVPKATLAGTVKGNDGKALAGATVSCQGASAMTDASGSYTLEVVVPEAGGTFSAEASMADYKAKAATVALTPGQPAAQDFVLLSTKTPIKLVINFKTGSAKLAMGNEGEISKTAALLKDNPTVKAEIAGYTDNRGSAKKNMRLSQARSDAVKAALVAAGVSADQLTSKGYGPENPIAPNTTRAGRAANRRIELHIL